MLGTRVISVEEAERSRRARARREAQTEAMARRLRASGIEVQRKDVGPVVALGAITGEILPVENRWRNVNFLPSMQMVHGAKHRAAMGAYIAQHPKGRFTQYWVLTGGERCEIAEVDKRFAEMTRALSRFVHSAKTEFPWVEFVARQNEVTINKDRMAHCHINLALIFLEAVEKSALIEFSEKMRSVLGGWVKNNRKIKSIDEFVKYTTKFGIQIDEHGDERGSTETRADVLDSLQLDLFDVARGRTDDYLSDLYRAMYKRRNFGAFGEFAKWRRQLGEDRVVPRRIGDDYVLVEQCPYRARAKNDAQNRADGEFKAENLLLNWAMPHSHGADGTVVEPTLRVIGFTNDPATPAGIERLAIIRDLADRLRAAVQPLQAKPADNVVLLAEERAKRAPLYGSHKHDNCPEKVCPLPPALPIFESIPDSNSVVHVPSLAVMTREQAEAAGFVPTPRPPRPPIIAPDALHERKLREWASEIGNPARFHGEAMPPPRDWRQYELVLPSAA